MGKPRTNLTLKQERFVQEYLAHGNGTKAAIAAGYSRRTARAIACENLKKPAIAAELAKRQSNRRERAEANNQRIIEALARIAFSDLSGIFGAGGKIIPPHEWSAETWDGIQSFRYSEKTAKGKDGKLRRVGQKLHVKAKDKIEALDQLLHIIGAPSTK